MFRGEDLNGFLEIKIHLNWRLWGNPTGDPNSMSLNVSCHKAQQYIGLGWGSDWFLRYEYLYALEGVGHTHRGPMVCVTVCILS